MEKKDLCANFQVLVLFFLCNTCVLHLNAQAPAMEWHKGFGTDLEEHVHEGQQTSDLGYIGIGQNQEREGDETNILVVKADSQGRQQWIQEIGTQNEWDVGFCVKETVDGFIIGVGIYNPDTDRQERGLAKLDFNGNLVWQKTYPGTGKSGVRGIDITDDGEIIATGYTDASDGGFVFIVEEGEGFIMKADSDGNLVWDKSISAPQGTKVRIEKDGGLAIASTMWVYTYERDNQDVILIRTDSAGNEISLHTYGAEKNDQCFDFDLALDGGYIFAGHTLSYGSVNWDYLLIKVDSSGKQDWVKTFGQPRGYNPEWMHDESYGVRATPDGGYIVVGGSGDEYPYSATGHPSGPSDEWKAYLVKTDGEGKLLWEGVYPTNSVGNNAAEYVGLTNDGGYIVFTDTDSESPPPPNNFGFMKIRPDTIKQYRYIELELEIIGEGSVYPMNKYHPRDTTISFLASPERGWEFRLWSGDTLSTDNPLLFKPDKDVNLKAEFSQSTNAKSVEPNTAIRIVPNPVSDDEFIIYFEGNRKDIHISLMDSFGKLHHCEYNLVSENTIRILTDNISNGYYYLNVITKNRTYTRSLVIIH